jgi:hypothetical protein
MTVRQFDICPNPDRDSAGAHPYLVVLQTNGLADLNTRVVAPLIAPKHIPFFDRLMPEVVIKGARYVIDITNVGVVPTRELPAAIMNVESHRDRIIAAIDLVFTGV